MIPIMDSPAEVKAASLDFQRGPPSLGIFDFRFLALMFLSILPKGVW